MRSSDNRKRNLFTALLGRGNLAPKRGAPVIERELDGARDVQVSCDVPRTQELIDVDDARDNCLILKDATVVAAVGFSTIDDTLLTDADIQARQTLYYELLTTLRFPVQFLITTRPQNLDAYYAEIVEARERHLLAQQSVEQFTRSLGEFVIGTTLIGVNGFRAFFGLHPNRFTGLPGEAKRVAWHLCDPAYLTQLRGKPAAERDKAIAELAQTALSTVGWLKRWRRTLVEQRDTVEASILRSQAPVRQFFFVVSHNPRVRSVLVQIGGHITEEEFRRASARVGEYCRQIQVGIEAMDLPAWRATHDDLLRDIRGFFNPSQAMLIGRSGRLADAALSRRERAFAEAQPGPVPPAAPGATPGGAPRSGPAVATPQKTYR